MAVDGNSSTGWEGARVDEGWFVFYNPIPIRVTGIAYGWGTTWYVRDFILYASNDYITWAKLGEYTGHNTKGQSHVVNNRDYYKYYKIQSTFAIAGTGINDLVINAFYKDTYKDASNIFACSSENKWCIKY